MSLPSAHLDTFARDSLPPPEQWPELLFELEALQYPEALNCAAALVDEALAEGHGERLALRSDAGSWTYAALGEASDAVARVLVEQLDLVPGNRVLLRSPNTPMLVAAWLGVLKAGGVVVATMPLLRAGELAYIIDKAQIVHALCDHRLVDAVQEAGAKAGCLRQLLSWGEGGELEARMAQAPAGFETVATRSDDVALIAFTSGTTGQPKAAMHSHRDVLAAADVVGGHLLDTAPDDVYAGSPPIAFTFGLGAQLVFPLRFRAAAALAESPAPEPLLDFAARHGVTCLFTAPTAYRVMLPLIAGHDLSALRRCVSAGEPLPQPVSDQWHEATGIRIIDGLGTTEMMHIFIAARPEEAKPGAIGRALPGYRACVLDEHDQPAPPGSVGRLAVKGPTGCRYMADARQRDYVVNGWNVTGDRVYQDEEGYFWFQARNDDMIISSGYNIAGPEVEAALLTHPAVAQCAVVGVEDAERGQVVKAFVVPAAGHEPGADLAAALQAHAKREIAPYKYPRQVEFLEDLPKTPTGKVQRFLLRQRGA